MKSLPKSLGLLIVPIIYLVSIPLNQPNYSHAIIISGLFALIGFIASLELKYRPVDSSSELTELHKEYQMEQVKTNIQQIKTARSKQASMRDEFGSGGDSAGFKF